MDDKYQQFAQALAAEMVATEPECQPQPDNAQCVVIMRQDGSSASLDLTPVNLIPQPVTAKSLFENVIGIETLLHAYEKARQAITFEQDLSDAMQRVHPFAGEYLQQLLSTASNQISDLDARCIGLWVKQLDIYTAVKCVESLLNSRADLALLCLAEKMGWQVHFDHLAIRCGSAAFGDAERVTKLLCQQHGYSAPQMHGEQRYQFDDWNAYMVYKLLDNGQMIRIFIDQSDADREEQIIQHWNRVYGYTAHHLAIRVTNQFQGQQQAVPLTDIMHALAQQGVEVLTPTGMYTLGLLQQVFTRPEKTPQLPDELVQELNDVQSGLSDVVCNGKLLEIVSRHELTPLWKTRWYELYGMQWQTDNALHSVPVYNFFLPAQAAHVIRTSIKT